MPKYVNATKVNTGDFGFYVMASKVDQQLFIDKFGQRTFDTFQKWNQRIKNKGYSTDLTYHTKNTSIADMNEILVSVSDEIRDLELDAEGRKIPEDNGNYDILAKTPEWTVYEPHDYIASIHCSHGGEWCTAGRYDIGGNHSVKVSQAKEYFENHTKNGNKIYYCINNYNDEDSIAVWGCPKYGFSYYGYDDEEILSCYIKNRSESLYKILKELDLFPDDWEIVSGDLVTYNGNDSVVIVPDDVTIIGKDAFKQNDFIEYVTISDGVKKIGDSAFWDCRGLSNAIISDSVEEIGWGSFSSCSVLTDVIIGTGVNHIGSDAFYDCPHLVIHTVNPYVIEYCEMENIPYDNNI